MKVGSLVECVVVVPPGKLKFYRQIPRKNTTYTVRRRWYNKTLKAWFIYLDEITGGFDRTGLEYPYPMKWFIEVQPPMDLTQLLEQANLLIT